jgi:hypothetical protein
MIILQASSIDRDVPTLTPTPDITEFLKCKSAGAAHQHLLDFFAAHKCGKCVAISTGLSTAL